MPLINKLKRNTSIANTFKREKKNMCRVFNNKAPYLAECNCSTFMVFLLVKYIQHEPFKICFWKKFNTKIFEISSTL